MMALDLENPGGFNRRAGEAITDTPSLNIEQLWSADDVTAVGLCVPEPAGEVPEGMVSTGLTVERVEDLVHLIHALEDIPVPTLDERN